ncbi:MAG: membrane protein [Candidatus Hepatoplasma scabrum]|nr:MAG: membrane protein [Candidatus Hepatoplasma sp.]
MDGIIQILIDSTDTTIVDIMVWVSLSLILFEMINIFTKDKFYSSIEHTRIFQPFLGALMGSIPGCSGPIIVTNLYNKKKVTFGTLCAAFISTFGDAAFVYLANDWLFFMQLLVISFIVGVAIGYLLDFTPWGKRMQIWLRKDEKIPPVYGVDNQKMKEITPQYFLVIDRYIMPLVFFSLILFIFPETIYAVSGHTNEAGEIVPTFWGDGFAKYIEISQYIVFSMVIFFIIYYFGRKYYFRRYSDYRLREDQAKERYCGKGQVCVIAKHRYKSLGNEMYEVYYDSFVDSIFIMVWVFVGVSIFTFIYNPFEEGWNKFFMLGGGSVSVLIGVFVGMIPGCGPQIAFANIFFQSNGSISRSAVVANSINQDGDAEFLLMTTNKKTFFVMGLFNSISALIVGFAFLPWYG